MTEHSDGPALLTIRQTAKILGASESQVRKLVRENRLAHVPIGSRSMVRRDRLNQFIELMRIRDSHAPTKQRPKAAIPQEA
ncbi:helix-turn-helix domain-containing protein [Bradyrhizobium septentrionale]|uniref:helix-turn-helix domain-containing protein n=1 Tax=Bradyrhizobium septentrionale TaxID=1404411 RepID=UPI003BB0D185